MFVARRFKGVLWPTFAIREARRHSRHYVERFDRAKAGQGVPLSRRSTLGSIVRFASRGMGVSRRRVGFGALPGCL